MMFNVSVVQMFENWCTVLDASLKESAEIIFEKFKKPR